MLLWKNTKAGCSVVAKLVFPLLMKFKAFCWIDLILIGNFQRGISDFSLWGRLQLTCLIAVKSNRCWGSWKRVWCLYDDRQSSHHQASSPIQTSNHSPVTKVLIGKCRPFIPHLRTKIYFERDRFSSFYDLCIIFRCVKF